MLNNRNDYFRILAVSICIYNMNLGRWFLDAFSKLDEYTVVPRLRAESICVVTILHHFGIARRSNLVKTVSVPYRIFLWLETDDKLFVIMTTSSHKSINTAFVDKS